MKIEDIANELNISTATVRNWIKTGIIPIDYTRQIIIDLKDKIENGEINKLNKRANKSKSKKSFIPTEYINNTKSLELFQIIVNILNEKLTTIEEKLYIFSLSFIECLKDKSDFENIPTMYFIIEEYNQNRFDKNESIIDEIKKYIKDLLEYDIFDIFGAVYQTIRTEGDKSSDGSYFTPVYVIDEMILDLKNEIGYVIDPSCGTGAFLIRLITLKNINPDNIYGVDIDKDSVFLTKLNILYNAPTYIKIPNIFNYDSLNDFANNEVDCVTNKYLSYFDTIITNPPWGSSKNTIISEKYEKLLDTKEIFSMFIVKCFELLKNKSTLNILLPISILNVQAHSNIRNYILKNSNIFKIKEYGRVFSGVFTDVVSIHLIKDDIDANNEIKIVGKNEYDIKQCVFLSNENYIIQTNIDTNLNDIITKIYSRNHNTLKNNSDWALGIVTGNNKKHIKNIKEDGMEIVYRGSDIIPYKFKETNTFIKFEREKFQQVAKDYYFKIDEKLVYKFISNKLVFSYDNNKSLTLNSANILIPNIPNYTIKTTLAFLNSSVFQFLFIKKFSTHKVLRSDLEQLPFPILNDYEKETIESMVNDILYNDANIEIVDDFIFKIFNLKYEEKKIIKSEI